MTAGGGCPGDAASLAEAALRAGLTKVLPMSPVVRASAIPRRLGWGQAPALHFPLPTSGLRPGIRVRGLLS